MYVLYNTSFGINISDNPVKHLFGIESFVVPLNLNTIMRINVIINIHTKKANALIIDDVSIEKKITPTQIIIGE
jgi:hypothetical protein